MTIRAIPQVELMRPEFDEFMRARNGLVEANGIEERFNMILENYAEFEAELLEQSLYNMMFEDIEWSQMSRSIHVFNRRLSNLLSTCRLYLDQAPRALHRIFRDDPKPAAIFKQARSEEYDAVLAYRVMEAIRNCAQHHNLPVTRFSVHNGEFPGHEKELNHHMVIPSLDLDKLRSDPDFKQRVLKDLDSTGSRSIDIRMLVRKYVEALARVNARVQAALSVDLDNWDSLMAALRTRFNDKWDGNPTLFVAVVCKEANGEICEQSYVAEEVSLRRKSLTHRNRHATSYSRQVVSNFAGTPSS